MLQKTLISSCVTLALLMASPVSAAECYADYKAKKDAPLRLHYGVVQLKGPCQKGAAKGEVASRIASGGWKLLNVLSVFGPEGLQQRKGDAGSFYLRF